MHLLMKPNNADISNVFDTVASRYDSVTSSYAIQRRMEFFVLHAKGACLEAGGGTGAISKALMEKGYAVTTTDISPRMVEEIKKKGIEAVVCDAEHLPFPDASFNTVISSEMIYYLDHPELFLREAQRVLKPGGVLLLSSANAQVAWFYDWLRAALRPFGIGGTYFDDPVHTFFSERELRQLAVDAGFADIQTKKILVLPVSFLDGINKILERTPLCYLGAFIMLFARR